MCEERQTHLLSRCILVHYYRPGHNSRLPSKEAYKVESSLFLSFCFYCITNFFRSSSRFPHWLDISSVFPDALFCSLIKEPLLGFALLDGLMGWGDYRMGWGKGGNEVECKKKLVNVFLGSKLIKRKVIALLVLLVAFRWSVLADNRISVAVIRKNMDSR